MSETNITLDDIFALFRESEQQRKEYQQAFEERQRIYELERKQEQQAFKERQRIAEQEMAALRKTVEQTNKQVGGLTSRWGEFCRKLN